VLDAIVQATLDLDRISLDDLRALIALFATPVSGRAAPSRRLRSGVAPAEYAG